LLLLVIVFITLFYNGCRKVSKAIRTCGQSHDAVLTAELDSYVELIEAVSPSVDDFVSTLYPPVNLPSVHTQVPSASLSYLLLLVFPLYIGRRSLCFN